jgi:hypothetical protein
LKDCGGFTSSGSSLLLLTDPEYEGVKVLESFKTSGNTGSVTLYYIPEGLILKILCVWFVEDATLQNLGAVNNVLPCLNG